MKKYDIIDLSLKIIGLSMLPTLINSFLLVVSGLLFSSPFKDMGQSASFIFLPALAYFVLLSIVVFIFIFSSSWIAGKIIRKAEIDEPLNLNINKAALLEIAITIIGGVSLLGIIPQLFSDIAQIFNSNDNSLINLTGLNSQPIASFAVTIIAILMIIYREKFAVYLTGKKIPHLPESE